MCETHTYYQLNSGGIKMKTALISAVYRKSLKMLQPNGKIHSFYCYTFIHIFSNGFLSLVVKYYNFYLNILLSLESDVVNLISVDCPNLQKAFRFLHFPWSCPLQIAISLYFLYDILDEAVIPGKSFYCQFR